MTQTTNSQLWKAFVQGEYHERYILRGEKEAVQAYCESHYGKNLSSLVPFEYLALSSEIIDVPSIEQKEEKKAEPVVTTKPCPRYGGSGEYSFNLRDGTRCYGCGGKGIVPCAPKGQKAIKPTVDRPQDARTGDIIKIQCVLYRVERLEWISYIPAKGMMGTARNQRLIATRLVDGKECSFKVEAMYPDIFNGEHGPSGIALKDGSVYPGRINVRTPDAWIGKTVEETMEMEASIAYWIATESVDAFLTGVANIAPDLHIEVDRKPVQGWAGNFSKREPVTLFTVKLTGTFKSILMLKSYYHIEP